MSDDMEGRVPNWSVLDSAAKSLKASGDSLYDSLSDDQLLRALEASRRGEPDPPDVVETLREARQRMPPEPAWLAAITDEELLADIERDRQGMGAPRRNED